MMIRSLHGRWVEMGMCVLRDYEAVYCMVHLPHVGTCVCSAVPCRALGTGFAWLACARTYMCVAIQAKIGTDGEGRGWCSIDRQSDNNKPVFCFFCLSQKPSTRELLLEVPATWDWEATAEEGSDASPARPKAGCIWGWRDLEFCFLRAQDRQVPCMGNRMGFRVVRYAWNFSVGWWQLGRVVGPGGIGEWWWPLMV